MSETPHTIIFLHTLFRARTIVYQKISTGRYHAEVIDDCSVTSDRITLLWCEYEYLKGRTMSVNIDGNFSQPAPLTQGFAQIFILAPL